MKLSSGNVFNLKRGEIKVFFGEIALDHDDTIRAWIVCPCQAECLSVEGQDYLGAWFDKLDKKAYANEPKRLWFYIKAPDAAGSYNGTISVTNTARKSLAHLSFTVNVSDELYEGDNFENPKDLSRLFWLNSRLLQNLDVPKPYAPVIYENNTVKILGREIELDDYGFPKRITSHFGERLELSQDSHEVLSGKIKFTVGDECFKIISSGAICENDKLCHSCVCESDNFMMKIRAKIEFDGFCDYKISLIAKRDTKLSNVNLCLPISEYSRKYFMGLGYEGGSFKNELNFKWSPEKNQDNFWIGNTNAGIRVKFNDENYKKPLTKEHYLFKPLIMPKSWDNANRGGILYADGKFIAYSGECEIPYGKKLEFNFNLIITPVKPIEKKRCSESDLSSAISLRYLDEGSPEFLAFKDFDEELMQQCEKSYVCNGESRICNFFTESINRLVEKDNVDGIYVDGTELDRNTLKRIRKVLDKRDGYIKLHTESHFTEAAGYAASLCTYLELFPFVDGISSDDNPDKPYDYRLVALSGIPFGISADGFDTLLDID